MNSFPYRDCSLASAVALTIAGLAACSPATPVPTPDAIRASCGEAAHGRFLSQAKSVLYVSDLRRATRFYVGVLGFETDTDTDNPI